MAIDLYRIEGPSEWATSPETFSHSSLTAIETCARRWQLGRSRYGELGRFPEKPNRAAIAGELVHELLDELFKALSLAGCPPLGSPRFIAETTRFGLRDRATRRLEEKRASWRRHSRVGARALDLTVEQITNKVIQLFREEYSGIAPAEPLVSSDEAPRRPLAGSALSRVLDRRGSLSEVALVHPELPFTGTIDLVRRGPDGVVVLDFKTGASKPEHETQVLLYALLWWRNTGNPCARAEVRYPRTVHSVSPTTEQLRAVEDRLRARITDAAAALSAAPAPASTGAHCRYCSYRAFCDDAWTPPARPTANADRVDVEVTVVGRPLAHGFEGRTPDGRTLAVVHGGTLIVTEGERLRVLDATWNPTHAQVLIGAGTEIFRRNRA